jgi:hypothetical protein
MLKTLWSRKNLANTTLAILFLMGQPVFVKAEEPPPAPAVFSAEPRKPAPGADELQELLIARSNAALAELQAQFGRQELTIGRIATDLPFDAVRRWRDSALELSEQPTDQMVIRLQTLEIARYFEAILEAKEKAGTAKVADVQMAHYFRIDAEIQVLKAKQKMENPK